jgi:hypothetical protein
VLDAGFGPGAGEEKPLDVQFAQHGVEPRRIERAVVLLLDLKVARFGIEFVNDLGVGGADDAVRAEDLEVLVDRHFLGQKVVLDKDDGDAAFAAAVDHAPHGGEQALGVERIRQGRVALEEAFEQVDDDDRAPRAHSRPPQ